MAWHTGDVWEPKSTVTNPKAADPTKPVKPGSCVYTFKSHKGAETNPSVTEVSEGVFEAAQELTEPGEWTVSVTTTAPFRASQPASIPVKPAFDE
jgi:nitrogen fixation protein FixH